MGIRKEIRVIIAALVLALCAMGSRGYKIWLPQNPSKEEAASFVEESKQLRSSSPSYYIGGGVNGGSKRYEGSSEFVHMAYHMGPVLTSTIRVYIVWYGGWRGREKAIVRDFLRSLSGTPASGRRPTVAQWWSTARLYTDQTGANVSKAITVAGEAFDRGYSHGKLLSRMSVQEVIRRALATHNGTLPVDSSGGLYLVLTSADVEMQDFCRAVCGFHYFTFPSIVGYTLPYAWAGNSAQQCPQYCAYPFAVPPYMQGFFRALAPPNGDVGVDGLVSVVAHELAEISSNPLINAWYAGNDPTAPTEIADLCEGIYGSGGGGGYLGAVLTDRRGASFNMHGVKRRKFLVQWLWNPVLNYCVGPNAPPNPASFYPPPPSA